MKKLIEELEHWNKHLSAYDKRLKYEKMAQSEYIFFRGTNHLFWRFVSQKSSLNAVSDKNTKTWIQGDLHAYNYGIYQNDKAQLVYDLNDFDESCIADYHYDLLRMTISMILIGIENLFKHKQIFHFIEEFIDSYLQTLENFTKENKIPDSITRKNAYGKLDEVLKQVKETKSRKKQIKEWTKTVENTTFFDYDHPKLVKIDEDLKNRILQAFEKYAKQKYDEKKFPENYFKVLDVAQRITSGTGSYGLDRYYILIQGKKKDVNHHVILDMKLQTPPSACAYLTQWPDAVYNNEALRHEKAYSALCKNVDNHLSALVLGEKAFSIRERSPYKAYFPTQILNTATRFKKMAQQWGVILASAHLRSYKPFNAERVIQLDELNSLSKIIITLAFEYVDYNTNAFKKFTNYLYLNE